MRYFVILRFGDFAIEKSPNRQIAKSRNFPGTCTLHPRGHTLVRMTDYQPNTHTPGNPFEFGITLLICIAVSATLAVMIAGIAFLVWR